MKVISFISAKGGTGRTTLAANTAFLLAHSGYRCAALDLDPQNALGTHFGMAPGRRVGFAPGACPSAELAEYLQGTRSRLPHIPFGWCTPQRLRLAEAAAVSDPDYVSRRISEVIPPEMQFLILDTPAGDNPWLHRALEVSDVALLVHLPDAANYATLPLAHALLGAHVESTETPLEVWHIVNQMDHRSPLARDVLAALGHVVKEQLLPFTIPRDEAVPEALAMQIPLVQHRPACAALVSLGQLAQHIATPVGDEQSAEPLQLAR